MSGLAISDVTKSDRPWLFKPGDDPRRHKGGAISAEMRELRLAMAEYAPEAVSKLWAFTSHENPHVALQATLEWLDRTIGKPKPMDQDTEANVHAELARVFGGLRDRFTPEIYAELLKAISERR